jgi:hypothetical protein
MLGGTLATPARMRAQHSTLERRRSDQPGETKAGRGEDLMVRKLALTALYPLRLYAFYTERDELLRGLR